MAKKKEATLNARDEIMLEVFKDIFDRLDWFERHFEELEDKMTENVLIDDWQERRERRERRLELYDIVWHGRIKKFAVYRRRLIALEKREKKLSEKS